MGAGLSHKVSDGSEKPIAFTSRSLTKTERKYSQLDKEALVIIFGVKSFTSMFMGDYLPQIIFLEIPK